MKQIVIFLMIWTGSTLAFAEDECRAPDPAWTRCKRTSDCVIVPDLCGWPQSPANRSFKSRVELHNSCLGATAGCLQWNEERDGRFEPICEAGECKARPKRMKEARISLEDPKVTLTFPIAKSKRGETDPEIYFTGVRACPPEKTRFNGVSFPHTGKCLLFHTQFSADRWNHVPIALLEAPSHQAPGQDLQKVYEGTGIEVEKGPVEKFSWGTASHWNTKTMGSAHYIYLTPKNRDFALRIGPIAGLVLADYDLGFKKAKWAFAKISKNKAKGSGDGSESR